MRKSKETLAKMCSHLCCMVGVFQRERTQGECMMIAYKYKQVFLNNIKYVEVNDKRKRKLNPFHFCHRNF